MLTTDRLNTAFAGRYAIEALLHWQQLLKRGTTNGAKQ